MKNKEKNLLGENICSEKRREYKTTKKTLYFRVFKLDIKNSNTPMQKNNS